MQPIRLQSIPFLSASGVVAMARRSPGFDKPLAWAARRFLSSVYEEDPEAKVSPILDRACDVRQEIRIKQFANIKDQAGGAFLLATSWPDLPVWALLALLNGHYTVEKETDTVVVTPVPAPGVVVTPVPAPGS